MSGVGILHRAVRLRVVARYCGFLGLIVATTAIVPLIVSIAYGDGARIVVSGIATLGFAAVAGVAARLRAPADVRRNEALCVLALVYVAASGLMALQAHDYGLAWIDALFEAISGITTTGLSTRATLAGVGDHVLFFRSWLQWVGGFGFATLSIALLLPPGAAGRSLADDAEDEELVGNTRRRARMIVEVYLAASVVGFVALLLTGMGPRDSLMIMMCAVSTGGFTPTDASLANLTPLQGLVSIGLCALTAVPLVIFVQWRRRQAVPEHDVAQTKLFFFATGLLIAALVLCSTAASWSDALVEGTILAISAQSTAGFTPLDVAETTPLSKLLTVFAMTLGGCEGSTVGGIKMLRILVLLAVLRQVVRRVGLPRSAVDDREVSGVNLDVTVVRAVLALCVAQCLTVFVSLAPFVAYGYDPLDALYDVCSAVSTVGLSTGVCSHELPWGLKLVLCADMLLGRLEFLAWVVLLSVTTWLPRRSR